MNLELVETPWLLTLFGCQGLIDGRGVPFIGKQLMDQLWSEVRRLGLKTTGINHWVYLEHSQMLTGVELVDPIPDSAAGLTRIEVSHLRHVRYVHRGEYSKLADIWPKLFHELKDRSLTPHLPHLEIYGHWNQNPELCETTIVIGLA